MYNEHVQKIEMATPSGAEGWSGCCPCDKDNELAPLEQILNELV